MHRPNSRSVGEFGNLLLLCLSYDNLLPSTLLTDRAFPVGTRHPASLLTDYYLTILTTVKGTFPSFNHNLIW